MKSFGHEVVHQVRLPLWKHACGNRVKPAPATKTISLFNTKKEKKGAGDTVVRTKSNVVVVSPGVFKSQTFGINTRRCLRYPYLLPGYNSNCSGGPAYVTAAKNVFGGANETSMTQRFLQQSHGEKSLHTRNPWHRQPGQWPRT